MGTRIVQFTVYKAEPVRLTDGRLWLRIPLTAAAGRLGLSPEDIRVPAARGAKHAGGVSRSVPLQADGKRG